MSCCSSEGTCSSTGSAEGAPVEAAAVVYTVQGMTCSHCEQAIAKEVSAIAGVVLVSADAAGGRVTVTATGELDDAAVRAAVAEAGYEMVGRA